MMINVKLSTSVRCIETQWLSYRAWNLNPIIRLPFCNIHFQRKNDMNPIYNRKNVSSNWQCCKNALFFFFFLCAMFGFIYHIMHSCVWIAIRRKQTKQKRLELTMTLNFKFTKYFMLFIQNNFDWTLVAINWWPKDNGMLLRH